MSQLVTNFTGGSLYLDTMTFHILLRTERKEASELFERIEHGDIQAFTSVLTFDELAYRMLLSSIKDKYGKSPLNRLREDREAMINEFYPTIEPLLSHFHTFPNLTIHDIRPEDLSAMHKNILQYHLNPRDALHLATMHRCDCNNLLSHDADFDNVTEVQRYTLY